MTITVSPELKQQLKEQRLRQLEAYYFELEMNKTAYEANGKLDQAQEIQKLMDETNVSYEAILNME